MKTSLTTISQTPYSLLQSVHAYIESQTPPGSEVLSFYTPAVAQLNRKIPLGLNEGEVSISILSDADSEKYHLTSTQMLKNYIAGEKAAAIVFNNFAPRSFAVSPADREAVLETLQDHYYLAKTFDNFGSIGNPRVKFLYVYLPK
jgi:hypothetical protein